MEEGLPVQKSKGANLWIQNTHLIVKSHILMFWILFMIENTDFKEVENFKFLKRFAVHCFLLNKSQYYKL